MQLWTHHPSSFRVDNPQLEVDYTKGQYAQPDRAGEIAFQYRKVMPRLHQIVGTTQFLWCCTKRGRYPKAMEEDSTEWELNVPLTQVLSFYRVGVWEDILYNRSDDWTHLLIAVGETEPAANDLDDLGGLIRVPLEPKWAYCHGQLPIMVAGVDRMPYRHEPP
jgi:hypothetical protein